MKKIILIVLCLAVSAAVFAGTLYYDFGMGYRYLFGKAKYRHSFPYSSISDDLSFRTNLFDFKVGFEYENDKHLTVYENVSLGFGSKFKVQAAGTWESVDIDKIFSFEDDCGVGYSFLLNRIRILAGAGLHFDFDSVSDKSGSVDISGIGLNFILKGTYEISDKLGASLAVSPNYIFSNSFSGKNVTVDSGSGFCCSVIAGVTIKQRLSKSESVSTSDSAELNYGRHYIGHK